MKSWVFVLIVVMLLIGAPASMACEACHKPGAIYPPTGEVLQTARCESGVAEGDAGCIPNGADCETWKDSTCTGTAGNDPGPVDRQLRVDPPKPVVKNCKVDVSGKCNGAGMQREQFLR